LAQKKAQDSTASKTLARHLEKGATGKLTVGGSGGPELAVYVQNGALMAAESAGDGQAYLRRLRAENGVPEARLDELEAQIEAGEPVFGMLLDVVPPALLDKMLVDRFRDNLARFLGSGDKPRFEFTAGVFVDNLQVGIDSQAEIRDAAHAWDASCTVDAELPIARGREKPRGEKEARLAAALSDGAVVSTLLPKLPLEPIAARATIATMLAGQSLKVRVPEPPKSDLAPISTPAVSARRKASQADDEPTVAAAKPARRNPTPAPVPDELVPEEVVSEEVPTRPVVAPSTDGDAAVTDLPDDLELEDQGDDGLFTEDVTEEARPEHVAQMVASSTPAAARDDGAGDLTSLNAWMNHGVPIDDDLEAFADYDEVRGTGSKKGGFTVDDHNLEKVEVSLDDPTPPPDEPEEEAPLDEEQAIEADEIPQAKFAAPTLTEEEIISKIDVANEVLSGILSSFDGEQGAGAGRAALQLLIDGSPAKFAALFFDVQIEDDGMLPGQQLVQNLYQRPPSEHRHLLGDGLVDLIERTLSIAADELTSDQAIDDMLEKSAGYRQRMGF
jgi:hypothetical protein